MYVKSSRGAAGPCSKLHRHYDCIGEVVLEVREFDGIVWLDDVYTEPDMEGNTDG